MTLSSPQRQPDLVADLNQKALLGLAANRDSGPLQRAYRLPTPEDLQALFPDLEILELLGTGGMGCVYKARQKKLDRMVAVKILPRELAQDGAFAERFSREARAMARLDHPNIVAIHDFGQVADLHYLTMQYMDGMNLRELIDAKAIGVEESLAVFTQVAQALSFAHDEGVVHRDIKPENILFDKSGHVALADFGLARLAMDSSCEVSLTQTRQAMGTLNYMAPEQYENPKAVDHRADVYAMGVLLYELITGKIPRGSFPPASTVCPSGPNVDHVITRALQTSMEDRYADVPEMVADLANESPAVRPRFGGNGTLTNFVNIGAAPFRLVGKIVKGKDGKRPSGSDRTWMPLHKLTYVAIAGTVILMLFPWSREHSQAGLFTTTRDIPVFLILPILVILSQLAKYRQRLHPIRWFLMTFFCFIGAFGIAFDNYHSTFVVDIFCGMMGILAFEYSFFVLDSVGRKLFARTHVELPDAGELEPKRRRS